MFGTDVALLSRPKRPLIFTTRLRLLTAPLLLSAAVHHDVTSILHAVVTGNFLTLLRRGISEVVRQAPLLRPACLLAFAGELAPDCHPQAAVFRRALASPRVPTLLEVPQRLPPCPRWPASAFPAEPERSP